MDSIYTKVILTIIAVCLLVQTFDLNPSKVLMEEAMEKVMKK